MTSDTDMNKDFAGKYPKVTPEHIQGLMDKVVYIPSRVANTTTTLVVSYIKNRRRGLHSGNYDYGVR